MENNPINTLGGIYRIFHRTWEIHEEYDNNESSSNSSLNENYKDNEVDADGMNKGEILMKSGEFGIVRVAFNFFNRFYFKQNVIFLTFKFINLD
jgi:hypothetical protein